MKTMILKRGLLVLVLMGELCLPHWTGALLPVGRSRTHAQDSRTSSVALYVPAFESVEALGMNVATILNLQIWKTLRKAPFPNPKNLNFGNGTIYWGSDDTPISSHSGALQYMSDSGQGNVRLDAVLWGKTWQLADGVVAQPYLSLNSGSLGPAFESETSIWMISMRVGKNLFEFEADIPSRFYEFEPIILNHSIVQTYSSPAALKLYSDKDRKNVIGTLSGGFVAKEFGENWAHVRAGGQEGYIHLPLLGESRTEVIDFVGALIRCFRGDWEGAISLFHRVVTNPNAPTSLRLDAYLYTALARAKLGSPSAAELQRAYDLNPFYRPTVVYSIMNSLESLRGVNGKSTALSHQTAVKTINYLLQRHNSMFPPDDPFGIKLRDLLSLFGTHDRHSRPGGSSIEMP